MREKHKLFICEKCFTTFSADASFTALDKWTAHTKGGEDPCYKSCDVTRCKRNTRTSQSRPNPCYHLESNTARWEAARSVIHGLLSQPSRLDDTGSAPPEDLNSSSPELAWPNNVIPAEIDWAGYFDGTVELPPLAASDGDIFAGSTDPEASMAAIHNLGPVVAKLRQDLVTAREAQTRLEARMAAMTRSHQATQHSLTRACEDLAETDALSPTARRLLQEDAPEVLFSIDRGLSMRKQPNVTSVNTSFGLSELSSVFDDSTQHHQHLGSWINAPSQPLQFNMPPPSLPANARGDVQMSFNTSMFQQAAPKAPTSDSAYGSLPRMSSQ